MSAAFVRSLRPCEPHVADAGAARNRGAVRHCAFARGRPRGHLTRVALCLTIRPDRGCNSVVECQLPKLDVAGSTPVTRSIHSAAESQSGTKRLRCPTCGRDFERSSSLFAPFCSERCKLLDLGNWLDERYRIPGDEVPGSDDPDSDDGA